MQEGGFLITMPRASGGGSQYGDGSKLLVIDDLRRFKIGGNLSMKIGTATFDDFLIKSGDGAIVKWGNGHPVIKVGRFAKILGMECWWIPLAEAEKAVAEKGCRLVVSGNKVSVEAAPASGVQ